MGISMGPPCHWSREDKQKLEHIAETLDDIKDALVVIMHFSVSGKTEELPTFTAHIMDRFKRLTEE